MKSGTEIEVLDPEGGPIFEGTFVSPGVGDMVTVEDHRGEIHRVPEDSVVRR